MRRKDGKNWDLSLKATRDEATKMIIDDEPFMLVGSIVHDVLEIAERKQVEVLGCPMGEDN